MAAHMVMGDEPPPEILDGVVVPEPTAGAGPADARGDERVDVVADAWLVTRPYSGLVYASAPACALLGRSHAEMESLFGTLHEGPAVLRWLQRVLAADGRAEVDVRVAGADGRHRTIHVVSRVLPPVPRSEQTYLSVLTEHPA